MLMVPDQSARPRPRLDIGESRDHRSARGTDDGRAVDLDDDQTLTVGDRVELRDEGGAYCAATVEAIEPGSFGRRYRLQIKP